MTQSTRSSAIGPVVLAGMILLAALSRLVPHPPNFSPIEAVALFGGAYFAQRVWAIAVPLIAMAISDLLLGLANGGVYLDYFLNAHFMSIYACIALCTLLGFGLRGRVNGARVLGYSLAGSVLFFLVTNFAVWMTANPTLAPACGQGLGACYAAGLPFFQWTLLGTLFYSALLFGSFALLRSHIPQLRSQTA
ncbi:MAG TPA: DUF6580 family putative transport protein [Xanthomonadaceae bacterium]|jgi:hypothetical protein|nr:DUF6580 family putative transport protein [Xanthomonadaceae bacterium]